MNALRKLGVNILAGVARTAIRAYSAASYDNTSADAFSRRRVPGIERGEEDDILTQWKSLLMTNSGRDLQRNYWVIVGIINQLCTMTIGTEGGKLSSVTDDEAWNEVVDNSFRDFSDEVDFFDNTNLNESMNVWLAALANGGGDFLAIQDDGSVTMGDTSINGGKGTGKFLFFESDCIANLDTNVFNAKFGAHGYTQKRGIIYNKYKQMCGVVVGTRRGATEYQEKECFILGKDPNKPFYECNWFFVKNKWRIVQGRGVSMMASATGIAHDSLEIGMAELQTVKTGAATLGKIKDTRPPIPPPDPHMPGNNLPKPECPAGGGGETKGGGSEETEEELRKKELTQEVLWFQQQTGGKFINVSNGFDLEFFNSMRPNNNLIPYLDMLHGGMGFVLGLGHCLTTGKVPNSFTGFQGEILITERSLQKYRKKLERGILTWMALRRIMWEMETGRITLTPPENWKRKLFWIWPKKPSVKEEDEEKTIASKLRNNTSTLLRERGPGWKADVLQRGKERKLIHENNLNDITDTSSAGGMLPPGEPTNKNDENGETDEETD